MSNQVLYKDYFPPAEAADYLGVSRETFDREFRPLLPALKISPRKTLFRRIDLSWIKEDPEPPVPRMAMYSRMREIAVRQRTPSWADHDAILAVYVEARRLTQETGTLHHVDHEIPLRGILVSGLHVHQNLRAIPAIDNLKKGNR